MTQNTLERRDWISLLRWHGFIWLLIPLIWAMTYLPQLGARDLRLEEGRRAQPAREMLETGNWITPKIYGETYLNKPPLFFWVSAAVGKLQSAGGGHVDELSIRLPSVISALLGAWLILFFAHKQLTRQTRALAALIFLSMPTMLDKGTLGEIDALLSLLTFACFAFLWEAYDESTKKIAIHGWLLAGLSMAAAALLKGPGGPIQFYAIFVPFLFFTATTPGVLASASFKQGAIRTVKTLLSPGHLLMVAIAVVPTLLWIYAMIRQSNLGAETISYQWADQLGLRKLLGTPAAFPGQKEPTPVAWEHYAFFPWQVLLQMLPPWSLIAILPTIPAIARRLGWTGTPEISDPNAPNAFKPGKTSRDLWLLLALSAPALILVFWAYPAAFARHIMMIAYPVSVLTAMFITSTVALRLPLQLERMLHSAAIVLAASIAILGIACIVLAYKFPRPDLTITVALGIAAIFANTLLIQVTRRTPVHHAPVAAAATLAILMSLGWGLVNSCFRPKKAPSDSTRIVHNQIDAAVPKNVPIFTTRTLLSGRGNDYFNIQFYLPTTPIGINELADIPPEYRGKRAVLVIGWNEWPDLMKILPTPDKFTVLHADNGPPHLYAIELTLPKSIPPATTQTHPQ